MSVLIDADPLIALFAADDKHHQRFDRLVSERSISGRRLISAWPCVVEASYLLDVPQSHEMPHWIEWGGIQVSPIELFHLGDMVAWMQRSAESNQREMDLADASG